MESIEDRIGEEELGTAGVDSPLEEYGCKGEKGDVAVSGRAMEGDLFLKEGTINIHSAVVHKAPAMCHTLCYI